eukprot:7792807-Heterocapsa_arctica.AAC.1
MKEMHGDSFRTSDYKDFYEEFGNNYFAKIVEKKDGYKKFYKQYGTSLKMKDKCLDFFADIAKKKHDDKKFYDQFDKWLKKD